MKKYIITCWLLLFAFAATAQLKESALRPANRNLPLRTNKKLVPLNNESLSAIPQLAQIVAGMYLSYIDFSPHFTPDGKKPDTQFKIDLYNSKGALLANYVSSGSIPWPTDPDYHHPVGDVEIPIHGGHKMSELMGMTCSLKITIMPVHEDTVSIFPLLKLKYTPYWYWSNTEMEATNHPEYGMAYGSFIVDWHLINKSIELTRENPSVTIPFYFNRNSNDFYGSYDVFKPQ